MTQQDIFTAALQITDPDGRAAYLAQFKRLEAINDKPVADFWKEVDGK